AGSRRPDLGGRISEAGSAALPQPRLSLFLGWLGTMVPMSNPYDSDPTRTPPPSFYGDSPGPDGPGPEPAGQPPRPAGPSGPHDTAVFGAPYQGAYPGTGQGMGQGTGQGMGQGMGQ